MRTLALASLFFSIACGGGGTKSTTTIITVPASSTPSAMTTTPPSTTINIGIAVTGTPSMMTPAPSSMPSAPASSSDVQSVNTTVVNVIVNYGYQESMDCTALGLNEGEGYCDGETSLIMCSGGAVYDSDRSTWNNSACGYDNDGSGATVDCMERDGTPIAAAVSDDASYAYTTTDECSQAQEGSASCDGSYATWCQDGYVVALDCSTYTVDGQAATCGINDQMEVDCLVN